MTWGEWQGAYRNLCVTFGRLPNPEQGAAYFEILSAFSPDTVEAAVVLVAREQRTWPKAADLFGAARGIARGRAPDAPECATCHGSWFVAMPDQTHHDRLYTNYVGRCPTCRPAKASAA